MNIGIFYGSNGGITEEIAEKVADLLKASVTDIADAESDSFEEFDCCILASSTWGFGDLPDSWEEKIDILDEANFDEKYIAFIGVGDQANYSDTFCSSLGTLYEKIKDKNIKLIGQWPTEGYEFDDTTAIVNEKFLGLILDEDNQAEMTDDRIATWVENIKKEIL